MNLGGSIIGEKEFPTNNGRALKMKGSSSSSDRSSYDPYDLGYSSSLYSNGNSGKNEGPNSNIEGILKALVRNGAKKAEVAEPDGTTSFLSQFFGKRK
uniref:Phosphoprotein n=1 Tax=Meloidogyne hapla TaxID=6305 RepID=A0A1I8B4V8_MELHA